MKIIVLGGDGFCGWPTSLKLSASGHDVIIVDNLSRRWIDSELGVSSLTPISTMQTRIKAWKETTGKTIGFENIDVSNDFDDLLDLFEREKPDTVIHFAEQRAAPYSMKSRKHKHYTMRNNMLGTHNVLDAIVESGQDIHLVHLGTMGVYGYVSTNMTLPDGYQTVWMKDDEGNLFEQEIIYPPSPGSVYHLTKAQEQFLFQFYQRNDEVAITDLHQGIVWGLETDETRLDPRLINRFDYDGDYGTVLNRFLIQAAIGYPMTVHGTGGQTRALIHIRDTVKCIALAVENPPAKGQRVRIANQMAETRQVNDLAQMIADRTGAEIAYVDNPRKEAAENSLMVKNEVLRGLGWDPILLDETLMDEVREIADKYAQNVDVDQIPCTSTWTKKHSAGVPVKIAKAS